MRKVIFILILVILCILELNAQWIQIYNKDVMCVEIKSPDSTDCLVRVLEEGFLKIIGSTDQGKTWHQVYNEAFYKVGDTWPYPTFPQTMEYPAKGYLYVGYNEGGMKVFYNRCKSFDTVLFPVHPVGSPILAISMADSITGLAAATQSIFFTKDGFKSYKMLDLPLSDSIYIKDVYCHDANNFAFVSCYSFKLNPGPRYYRTEDGGKTWIRERIDTILRGSAESIFFVNDSLGWMAGSSPIGIGQLRSDIIYKTTNGGKHWVRSYKQDNEPRWGLQNIAFSDSLNGVATGQMGKILRTTDGGVTWVQEYYTVNPPFSQPFFMSLGYIGSKPIIGIDMRGLLMRKDDVSVLNQDVNDMHLLFPNPALSTTRISLLQEGDISISAVDVLGRSFPLWSGFASTGDTELDVTSLPTGTYTLLINYGTKVEAVRLIKN